MNDDAYEVDDPKSLLYTNVTTANAKAITNPDEEFAFFCYACSRLILMIGHR